MVVFVLTNGRGQNDSGHDSTLNVLIPSPALTCLTADRKKTNPSAACITQFIERQKRYTHERTRPVRRDEMEVAYILAVSVDFESAR